MRDGEDGRGGSWPLYRRGEGVGEQRDKLYPESFGRRVRECVRVLILREKREVGDELTSGARLAAAVRGGERGRRGAVDRAEGVGRWGWPWAKWPAGPVGALLGRTQFRSRLR